VSAANEYKKKLGLELEELFEGEFKFYKSKLELKRKRGEGFDVIILSGSNKWSPLIDVSFYFGRNYDAARKIEKAIGGYPMYYQIQQYSLNVGSMEGLNYKGEGSWEVNLELQDKNFAQTIKKAIEDIAFPFFDRFIDIEEAREALSNNDSWCFSPEGPFYHMIFKIDAALNDIEHFKSWSKCLEQLYLDQAAEDIAKFEAL
jgi:hypothetical protein